MCFALVAQLVEHTLGKGEVSGSNPLKSSNAKADMKVSAFVLGVTRPHMLGFAPVGVVKACSGLVGSRRPY